VSIYVKHLPKRVLEKEYLSAVSDDRWRKYRVMILGIIKRVNGCE